MSIPMDPLAALREYLLTIPDIVELAERNIFATQLPPDILSEMPRNAIILQSQGTTSIGMNGLLVSQILCRCYGRDTYNSTQLALAVIGTCQSSYRNFLGRTLLHDLTHESSMLGMIEPDTYYPISLVTVSTIQAYDAWQ